MKVSRLDQRRATRPSTIDPVQLYSVDEAAAALDRSRAGVYNDIAAGRIAGVKDGARMKICGAEIIRVSAEIVSAAVGVDHAVGARLVNARRASRPGRIDEV